MSERIHVLAQQLFGKSSVDDCDLQEIKDLVSRFPYFAPAQFLLLEKLKRANASEYPAQLQKAVLYYHNPLEFEYFISSDRFETNVNFDESTEDSILSVQDDDEKPEQVIAAPNDEITNLPLEETVPAETQVKHFPQDLPETDVDPEIENAANEAQD